MSVILLDIIAEHIKNDKIRDVCNLGKMSHGNGFSMAFSSWILAEQSISKKEKLIVASSSFQRLSINIIPDSFNILN